MNGNMELKELLAHVKNVEKKKFFDTESLTDAERKQYLHLLALSLSGEAGEFSNIVKKILREELSKGKAKSDKTIADLKEELIDIFAYVMLAAIYLDVDLEKDFFEKMEKVDKRFTFNEKTKK